MLHWYIPTPAYINHPQRKTLVLPVLYYKRYRTNFTCVQERVVALGSRQRPYIRCSRAFAIPRVWDWGVGVVAGERAVGGKFAEIFCFTKQWCVEGIPREKYKEPAGTEIDFIRMKGRRSGNNVKQDIYVRFRNEQVNMSIY